LLLAVAVALVKMVAAAALVGFAQVSQLLAVAVL
jgi:hypothetical protein